MPQLSAEEVGARPGVRLADGRYRGGVEVRGWAVAQLLPSRRPFPTGENPRRLAGSTVRHVLTRWRHHDRDVEEGCSHRANRRVCSGPSHEKDPGRADSDSDKCVDGIG